VDCLGGAGGRTGDINGVSATGRRFAEAFKKPDDRFEIRCTQLTERQELLGIARPLSQPVNLFMRHCQQSVARKSFGMWPDILRFEPKRLLNGSFTVVTASCRALTFCETPSILLKSPSMFAHPDLVKGFREERPVQLQMVKTQNVAHKSLQ
jgi:hypothetical protein